MRIPGSKYPHDFGVTSDGFNYVEWYRDSAGNDGSGDNPECVRYWGTQQECIARSKLPPPRKGWYALVADHGKSYADALR